MRGADHARHPLVDRRRAVLGGVGGGEPAAEVVDREAPEPRDRRHRLAVGREVEELRADVRVDALEVGPARAAQPLGRGGRLRQREAELLVGVAGRDGVVGVGLDLGDDAQQHRLRPAAGASPSSRSISSRLSIATTSRCSTAVRSSPSDFALPCTTIRPGSKPAFSARCSSPAEATSTPRPSSAKIRSTAVQGKRLGREQHARAPAVVGGHRAHELARPGAQVVLGHDVGRRAVLAGELERVAAADRQAAVVDGRGLGVDGQRRGSHDARRLCAMRPPLPRPRSARPTAWPTRCGCPTAIRGPAW